MTGDFGPPDSQGGENMWRDYNQVGYQTQMSVTNVAAQLPAIPESSAVKKPERVLIQALSTNTAPIFIKNANDVTSNGSTGGHELPANSNMELPLTDDRSYYAIAAGTQKLQVTYLAR